MFANIGLVKSNFCNHSETIAVLKEVERKRKNKDPFCIADISTHAELIKLLDKLGFAALWMHELNVYDANFCEMLRFFAPYLIWVMFLI